MKEKKEKLTIICSFGAPHNNIKLSTSYYDNITLDQYSYKIKEKFNIPQHTKITFNFKGFPCLGNDRKCGIKKLGINVNDTIIAQTNGINLTIKSFESPNNIKLIEMYKYFDLNMLKEQIKIELGISVINQKALICKGWKLIDHDSKCRTIKEYETITVLTACHCQINKKNNKNKKYELCTLHRKYPKNNNNDYDNDNKENIDNYHNEQSSYHEQEYDHYTDYIDQNHYGFGASSQYNPPYYPQYREETNYYEYGDYKRQYDDDNNHYMNPQKVELMNFINTNGEESGTKYLSGDKLKICRYGDRCRYFKNPHISGPCRYYHPPPILEQDYSWKSHYTLHHGTSKKNKYKTNYTIS